MRIIERILGRFKRTRREDPFFGTMLFMGNRLNYWEGKANFPPTSSTIEVFVEGSTDDTMQQQHEFFVQLVREWQSLYEGIAT